MINEDEITPNATNFVTKKVTYTIWTPNKALSHGIEMRVFPISFQSVPMGVFRNTGCGLIIEIVAFCDP